MSLNIYFGWDYYNYSQKSEVKNIIEKKFTDCRPKNVWPNDADTLPLFDDSYDIPNGWHNLYSVIRYFYNQNYEIHDRDTSDLIKEDIPFIYVIGTKSGPFTWSEDRAKLFLNIKQHTKDYIKKGKVLLVVDMSDEGFPMESTEEMTVSEAGYYEHIGEEVYKKALQEDFPLENIVYLTSNYKIAKKYKSIKQMVLPWTELIMKNSSPNPIPKLNQYHLSTIDTWNGYGTDIADLGDITLDDWAEKRFEKVFNYKKDNLSDMKSFLCLCKLVKDWRLFHSLGLNYYGLHEKGLTSLILSREKLILSPYMLGKVENKKEMLDYEFNTSLIEDDLLDEYIETVILQCSLFGKKTSLKKVKTKNNIKNLFEKLPLYIDRKSFDDVNGFTAWDESFYNDTFFSYTYNTFATSNKTIYLTEKIWKDIMCFHPTILVSNPGSLKQLRKLGYKTHSPFIDERYDNLADFDLRSEALFLEMNKLCKMSKKELLTWYEKQSDILLFNFKHFVKSNPSKKTVDDIVTLYKIL